MDTKFYLRMCFMVDKEPVPLERGVLRALVEMAKDRKYIPEHQLEVIEHVRSRMGDIERESNVSFLAQFLHDEDSKLTESQHHYAMCLCDGYGNLSFTELTEKGLLYDWSHVRDSSIEALRIAREFVEKTLEKTSNMKFVNGNFEK